MKIIQTGDNSIILVSPVSQMLTRPTLKDVSVPGLQYFHKANNSCLQSISTPEQMVHALSHRGAGIQPGLHGGLKASHTSFYSPRVSTLWSLASSCNNLIRQGIKISEAKGMLELLWKNAPKRHSSWLSVPIPLSTSHSCSHPDSYSRNPRT